MNLPDIITAIREAQGFRFKSQAIAYLADELGRKPATVKYWLATGLIPKDVQALLKLKY